VAHQVMPIDRSINTTKYEKIVDKERSVAGKAKRAAIGCLLAYLAIAACILSMMLAAAIYRPLPSELGVTWKDRLRGRIFEPFTRLVYYYPSRLCPNALCMLHWTRLSIKSLTRLIGPWFDCHPDLLMETSEWDGVKALVYHPRKQSMAESDGAIVFFHGGGFAIGDIKMYESLTTAMAKQMSTRLFVSVEYRRVPETVFPGGLEDCEKILDFVIANGPEMYGIDPNKIVIMGDSAGGNIAAAITQRRKRRGAKPSILGQVLIYPFLQMSDLQSPSYHLWQREMEGLSFVDPLSVGFYSLWYAGVDVNAHPEYAKAATQNRHASKEVRTMTAKYMNYSLLPAEFRDDLKSSGEMPEPIKELSEHLTPFLTNPDFAPLMQPDLSHLPPALVITTQFDVLRDEGTLYAQRLNASGVPTQWTHYAHGFHGMLNLHNKLQIARDVIANITEWTMKLLRVSTA
ncbi:hypothetical protein PMAYCL1PPCAC_16169, partial [Pristionchus mayeri]